MTHHIILWKLKDEFTEAQKTEIKKNIKNGLDGLIKADVIYEKRLSSSNCDFMLDMYFRDAGALENFSVNISRKLFLLT